ncbi:MAG: hypothetical protein ACYC5M_13850 [Anaerolineae bacterium]
MKRRWVVYVMIGIAFGIFDFIYLGLLSKVPWRQVFGPSRTGTIGWFVRFVMLNLGIWLVPVVPIALYEARVSGSALRSAVASLVVWSAAIVAYYLTDAAELAFWGVAGREELYIANARSAEFWGNWASVFRGDILGGITEWIMVAIVGGATVGFVVGALYLRTGKARWVRRGVNP